MSHVGLILRLLYRFASTFLGVMKYGRINLCKRSSPPTRRDLKMDSSRLALTGTPTADQSRRPHNDPREPTRQGDRRWRQISRTASFQSTTASRRLYEYPRKRTRQGD